LFALGWVILLAGAVSFGIAELLGVRQVLDWYWEREPRPLPLKTQGLYRWLRHPMYVGVLLAVWATPYMTLGHGLLAAGLTVYVLIAKRYEERDLDRTYGRLYQTWTRAR
jgi:protein-S-isoprenylcysteine O-methyltransferase Ste14